MKKSSLIYLLKGARRQETHCQREFFARLYYPLFAQAEANTMDKARAASLTQQLFLQLYEPTGTLPSNLDATHLWGEFIRNSSTSPANQSKPSTNNYSLEAQWRILYAALYKQQQQRLAKQRTRLAIGVILFVLLAGVAYFGLVHAPATTALNVVTSTSLAVQHFAKPVYSSESSQIKSAVLPTKEINIAHTIEVIPTERTNVSPSVSRQLSLVSDSVEKQGSPTPTRRQLTVTAPLPTRPLPAAIHQQALATPLKVQVKRSLAISVVPTLPTLPLLPVVSQNPRILAFTNSTP